MRLNIKRIIVNPDSAISAFTQENSVKIVVMLLPDRRIPGYIASDIVMIDTMHLKIAEETKVQYWSFNILVLLQSDFTGDENRKCNYG